MDTVNACEYKCTECSKEYKAYKRFKKDSIYESNEDNYNSTRSIREYFVVGELHYFFRYLLLYRNSYVCF